MATYVDLRDILEGIIQGLKWTSECGQFPLRNCCESLQDHPNDGPRYQKNGMIITLSEHSPGVVPTVHSLPDWDGHHPLTT